MGAVSTPPHCSLFRFFTPYAFRAFCATQDDVKRALRQLCDKSNASPNPALHFGWTLLRDATAIQLVPHTDAEGAMIEPVLRFLTHFDSEASPLLTLTISVDCSGDSESVMFNPDPSVPTYVMLLLRDLVQDLGFVTKLAESLVEPHAAVRSRRHVEFEANIGDEADEQHWSPFYVPAYSRWLPWKVRPQAIPEVAEQELECRSYVGTSADTVVHTTWRHQLQQAWQCVSEVERLEHLRDLARHYNNRETQLTLGKTTECHLVDGMYNERMYRLMHPGAQGSKAAVFLFDHVQKRHSLCRAAKPLGAAEGGLDFAHLPLCPIRRFLDVHLPEERPRYDRFPQFRGIRRLTSYTDVPYWIAAALVEAFCAFGEEVTYTRNSLR